MTEWIYIVLQGLMVGGLYAILAAGLSIAFGVMRVINLAHGDVVVLAAFFALLFMQQLSEMLPPAVALAAVVILMFILGYGFQRVILNRAIGPQILPPLLMTFGLSVIIQNGLLQAFTADSRKLVLGDVDQLSFKFTDDIQIGMASLMIFSLALTLYFVLHFLIQKTRIGRSLRAASDDPHTLSQVGANPLHVYAVAMGLSFAICAIAGIAYGATSQFTPLSGPPRLLIAFEAVVIGGVGSLEGTLLGALLLGIVQSIGASFDPALQHFSGHVLFLLTLIIRPNGLFSRAS